MKATPQKREIPVWGYKLLILSAAIMWGLSFVVMKDTVAVMKPCWIIGIRFLLCALIFLIIFFKRIKATWGWDMVSRGIILGVLMFLAYYAQTEGLAHTTPGKNAFLTAAYVIMIPFLWWVFAKRRPTVFNVVAAVLCVAGIGLVCQVESLTIGYGDALTLVCAVFFAIHIVCVSMFTPSRDPYVLTFYQFFFQGLIALIVAMVIEPFPALEEINGDFIFNMVYLIVFASCLGLCIQNVGLAKVPPAQASIFLSLEAVFGVLFSVVLYGEQLTAQIATGFALIFIAILVSETGASFWEKRHKLPAKGGARDE